MRYQDFANSHLNVVRQSGLEALCICPFHDDSSPSFRFNVRSGLWLCFSCGARGNAEQLAARLHVSLLDTGVTSDELRSRLRRRGRSAAGSLLEGTSGLSEQSLARLEWIPYWSEQRKFSSATISTFQLKGDPDTGHGVIPVRNSWGNLSGCIIRKLDDSRPKYVYPHGFARNKTLFGSWLVRKQDHRKVALVEGPLDAVACWDAGVPAVAMLGATLSPGQVKLLRSLSVHAVVTMTDNDDAGKKAALQVKEMLRASGLLVFPARYRVAAKDPGELDRFEIERMFARAGTRRETF